MVTGVRPTIPPRPSGLPQQIPPPTAAFTTPDGLVEFNWYAFLYNLWKQSGISQGATSLPPSLVLSLTDVDTFTADLAQIPRQTANTALTAMEDFSDVSGPLQFANLALMEAILGDAPPAAQPLQTITVGASPYTYTVPFTGSVLVKGGTVSVVSLIRQGVTTITGLVSGFVPVSRSDQVQITYTAAPTAFYFPT